METTKGEVMNNALLNLLEKEKNKLAELLKTAQDQNEALITYNIPAIEKTTQMLSKLGREMKQLEEERIKLITNEIKCSKREAMFAKLSEILKEEDYGDEAKRIKNELKELIEKFTSLNSLNKLLANKAYGALSEILNSLSNGEQSMCNVKV